MGPLKSTLHMEIFDWLYYYSFFTCGAIQFTANFLPPIDALLRINRLHEFGVFWSGWIPNTWHIWMLWAWQAFLPAPPIRQKKMWLSSTIKQWMRNWSYQTAKAWLLLQWGNDGLTLRLDIESLMPPLLQSDSKVRSTLWVRNWL